MKRPSIRLCVINSLRSPASDFRSPALLLALSLLLATAAAGAQSFSLKASDWLPQEQSSAAESSPDGPRFPCAAAAGHARSCWDLQGKWDLRRYTHLELVVATSNAAPIGTLTLYLHSAAGWRSAFTAIPEAGRRRLIFPLGSFDTEGATEKWTRLDTLRLSVWRGEAGATTLELSALRAVNSPIRIVRGDQSVTAGEQGVAGEAAARVSRWLSAQGVGHAIVSETAVADDDALDGARLVILPYNPNPSSRLLSAWLRAERAGARFMVQYGASPELAKRLGFRLDAYRQAAAPGQWAAMTFSDDPPGGMAWIAQNSQNLYTVQPATADARVWAWWADARLRRQPEAAWLVSSKGWWMSHIWLDEDAARKQRLLLEMAGAAAPGIWLDAAEQARGRAGWLEPFGDWTAVTQALAARALAAGPRADSARAALVEAVRLHDELPKLSAAAVVDGEARLRERLTAAWAATRPSTPEFNLGVWDATGNAGAPGLWPVVIPELAAASVRSLFPLVWSPGDSKTPGPNPQLAACLNAVNPAFDIQNSKFKIQNFPKLECHAWVICNYLASAPESELSRLREAGRLQMTAAGATLPWLSPAAPQNAELLADALAALVKRYPVDGLHLDYIRYAQADAGFEPVARAAFERGLGRPIAVWPGAVLKGGSDEAAFRQFRADCIRALVKRIGSQLRATRPNIRLSAAVFPDLPSARYDVGQDWPAWVKAGELDFVCPMIYTESLAAFRRQVEDGLRACGDPSRVRPGIGASADRMQLRPDQVLAQLDAARQAGAGGAVIFSLNAVTRRDLLPLLKNP